jgi:putative endonuclease
MYSRKGGYVYITSNPRRTVLYTGSSSNMPKRMNDHKHGTFDGFSKKYNCRDLMYFEFYPDIADAVKKERQIKEWRREWKINLINRDNAQMKDLSKDWFDEDENLKEAQE